VLYLISDKISPASNNFFFSAILLDVATTFLFSSGQSARIKNNNHPGAMSMVTAATWVPRGFAAPFPTKYDFDEAEFERIAELAKLQLDDANEDLQEAQEADDGGVKIESGSGSGAVATKAGR
jgi:hypothetical protein